MAFLGQEQQVRELQDRIRFLYLGLFLGLGILTARLVYLQVLAGDRLRKYSEENRIKKVRIASPRGMIFDRNRKLLVDNQPAFDLEITPQYLSDPEQRKEVLGRISKLINLPLSEVQRRLDRSKNQATFLPVKIKTDLSRDEVAVLETWKLNMPGVAVEMEIQRTNVFGDIASHFLGYIGRVNQVELPALQKLGRPYKLDDTIGKSGIEEQLEDTVRGVDGQEMIEVDAMGRRIRDRERGKVLTRSTEEPAIPGKNLILTIDQDLQLAAVKAFGEKIGGLVALDPSSGEVLAMISRPSFDPTEFSRGVSSKTWKKLLDDENHPLRDKTIQDHYSPGSTFKVVTAIAGLEEGVIDENTRFHCPGFLWVGNRKYHCHKREGHGEMNVVTGLSNSCDVFFYRVAQRFNSVDAIAKWAFKLGLGKRTGIQLSREATGLIPTEAWKKKAFNQPWNGGETASVAIGQSFVLTTAMQLANLYATIANGGTLFRPHYIKAIETVDGTPVEVKPPEVIDHVPLKPHTLELVRQGIWGVINDPHGTARLQKIEGLDFVGKTGTSQVVRISADKIFKSVSTYPSDSGTTGSSWDTPH